MPCWRTTWLCKRAERKLDCHSNKLDDRAPTPLTATSTTTYSTNFCPRRFSGSARVDDNTAGVSGPYACTTSPSSSPLTATMSSRTSILPTAPSDYDGILPDFPSWSTSWSHTSSTSSPRNRPYSVNESSHPSRALIPHPHPGSCFGHQILAMALGQWGLSVMTTAPPSARAIFHTPEFLRFSQPTYSFVHGCRG